MANPLIRQRMIWWPTLWGWLVAAVVFGGSALVWCFLAEPFFSLTQRETADVMVVEGWNDPDTARAAVEEFVQGHYRLVVATGGMTGDMWNGRRWSLAEEAERLLLQGGLRRDQVILAKPPDVERQRTFTSAVAVWQALHSRGIEPRAINVFSLGVHARRSRLVYAKVQRPAIPVGVVSWEPAGYRQGPWWKSSSRAMGLLKESIGYPYELLLNSGRFSNAPESGPH